MMLSRVADAVYWMSRYLERADNIARFFDVNLHLMLDQPGDQAAQWEPLISVTGDLKRFRETYETATQENVMHFLTFDRGYSNSIVSCLEAARENARSIREVISSELWQQINRFYLMVTNPNAENDARYRPAYFYEQLRLNGYLCNGMCDFTMSHNDAWHFSQIGRLFERADKTTRILDVKYFMLLPRLEDVGAPIDIIQWSAVLNSASAQEMHRRKYRQITPDNVAEFLILDREFPRSIYFSLLKAEESMHAITGSPAGSFNNRAEQQLGALRAELGFSRIDEIILGGLHEYLDHFQKRLNRVDDLIFDAFFALRQIPATAIAGGGQ